MKKLVIIVGIMVFSAALCWGQFYDDLSVPERKELSEAYYLAGKQYQSVGKQDKGQDFVTMAYRIYPDFDPESIAPDKPIAKRSVSVQGTWRPEHSPIPQGITARNAVQYYFSKFLRGFLTEDKTAMLDVVDSRVYVPEVPQGMPKAEVEARMDYLFVQKDISTTPPSRIFDLQSIRTEPVERQIWLASIDFAADPAVDLKKVFGITGKTLDFYLRIIGEKWVVFAVQSLPEEVQQVIAPQKVIRDTLTACFQAFIEEKPAAASRYFTNPFSNIPYGKEVTREELQETFKGYFEEYDFSGYSDITVQLKISESVEVVHPGGPSYKVTLTLPRDMRGEIPFWSTFSGYYMVFDERVKTWKVFAIF